MAFIERKLSVYCHTDSWLIMIFVKPKTAKKFGEHCWEWDVVNKLDLVENLQEAEQNLAPSPFFAPPFLQSRRFLFEE